MVAAVSVCLAAAQFIEDIPFRVSRFERALIFGTDSPNYSLAHSDVLFAHAFNAVTLHAFHALAPTHLRSLTHLQCSKSEG